MKKTNHRKERMTAKSMVLATVALGFCLLLSALAPTTASADWGFNMGDDGKDPKGKDIFFQKIELFIPNVPGNAGVTWSGNGVSNFSSTDRPNPSSSWNANTQKINPTYVLATGTAIRGSLFWNVLFTGTPPAEFTLDYLVYKNTNSSPPAYAIQNGN